jgi:hypothetical protein
LIAPRNRYVTQKTSGSISEVGIKLVLPRVKWAGGGSLILWVSSIATKAMSVMADGVLGEQGGQASFRLMYLVTYSLIIFFTCKLLSCTSIILNIFFFCLWEDWDYGEAICSAHLVVAVLRETQMGLWKGCILSGLSKSTPFVQISFDAIF